MHIVSVAHRSLCYGHITRVPTSLARVLRFTASRPYVCFACCLSSSGWSYAVARPAYARTACCDLAGVTFVSVVSLSACQRFLLLRYLMQRSLLPFGAQHFTQWTSTAATATAATGPWITEHLAHTTPSAVFSRRNSFLYPTVYHSCRVPHRHPTGTVALNCSESSREWSETAQTQHSTHPL